MRKMLLLLLTLIGSVGAWAEETVITDLNNLSNSKVYVLKSGRSDGATNHYLLYHTEATGNLSSTYGSGHTMEYSSTTTNFQFAIYQQDDKYYFYNIAASKFIGNATTNNAAIPLVDLPTNDIEIRKESTVTDYPFMLSTNRSGALNVAATTGCHGVVNWSGGYNSKNDGGNAYQIIEVGDLSTELQTSILEKINQGAILAPAQAAVANASNTRVGAYKTTAVSTLNAAISAYNRNQTTETFNAVKTAYNNLIAEESNKVTLSAGETFTIKCVEDSRGYMVYSTVNGKGSETYPNLAAANGYSTFPSTISEEGVYPHWAFITIDGQDYLYNVQKQQFLKPEGVIPFSNRGYDFDFIAIENLLYEIKFTSNNRYLSFSPGWGLNNAVRTELGIDNGCKFYLDKTGNTVSADVVTAVTNKHNLGLWQDNQLAVLGYVGAYPKALRSAIEELTEYSQISTFESNNTKVSITDNGYYFLRSATNQNKSNAYMTYNGTSCYAYPLANGEKLSAKHVWQFTPIQGEDGYKLMSCNLGNYLQTAAAPSISSISSTFANGYKYVFTDQGDAKFKIADGNSKVIRTENGGDVNYWEPNNNATWYVIPAEELDLTIGATGYATAYLPFDVTLPEGLMAYAVTDANNTTATLKSQTSIPANKGAILKGTENTTYKVSIATASASDDWTGNKLLGTNVDTYVAGPAYVLSSVGDMVGLYKAILNKDANGAEGSTHFKNNANKAYLPASALTSGTSNVNALRFVFDDEATAIEGVVSEQQEGAIYDLSGRRVQKAQKGIYIINGKKVVK